MSAVFVTGVAGFLGSHLAEALLAAGHRVCGADNLLGGLEDNVPAGVEFTRTDVRDFDAVRKLLRGVEVVYHCAAAPHEGLSVFSPTLVAEHTYHTTVATASAAIATGVRRIVFCSSMARYGLGEGVPFTEEMARQPVDPYGIAKVAGEMTIEALSRAHGIEYTHAVPHNIIGTRQRYDDPFRNVASIMINLMLQGRQPIIYGDGEQKRCFSYVGDVVRVLVRMGFQANVRGEVINVGPDEEFISVNELARVIAEIIGFSPLKPQYVGERPLEVRFAHCSAEKSRRLLGYRTTARLRRALEEMVAYVRAKGPRPFRYHLPLEIVSDRTPVTWRNRVL